jgi:hypothetical protein
MAASRMSASGQTRKCRHLGLMSALPRLGDIVGPPENVRKVPQAEIDRKDSNPQQHYGLSAGTSPFDRAIPDHQLQTSR